MLLRPLRGRDHSATRLPGVSLALNPRLTQLPQDRKKIEEFENSLGDWAGSI